MRNLYEDKALGKIPEQSYFAMVEQVQAEFNEKSAQFERLKSDQERATDIETALISFFTKAKQIATVQELTRDMLRTLIEKTILAMRTLEK